MTTIKKEKKAVNKEVYSTAVRMSPKLYKVFKETITYFKGKNYSKLFTINDLLEAVCTMPRPLLEKEVNRVMAAKCSTEKLADQLAGISEDARAKIEAILAEEAAKKG